MRLRWTDRPFRADPIPHVSMSFVHQLLDGVPGSSCSSENPKVIASSERFSPEPDSLLTALPCPVGLNQLPVIPRPHRLVSSVISPPRVSLATFASLTRRLGAVRLAYFHTLLLRSSSAPSTVQPPPTDRVAGPGMRALRLTRRSVTGSQGHLAGRVVQHGLFPVTWAYHPHAGCSFSLTESR